MHKQKLRENSSSILLLDALFITVIFIIAFMLYGVPSLFVPDEGRYAEIAREMITNHQYLVPHINGVIYFEKPPLIYWLTSFFMSTFGQNEWGARLANPFLSLVGIYFVYFACHIVYKKRKIALWASLICGTSLLYLGGGRYLSMDAGVASFINMSLLCYWVSNKYPNSYIKSTSWLFFAFVFSGCAVMSKGFIGVVFPMMIIGIWCILTSQYKKLLDIRLYLGLLIVVLISAPWIIAVNNQYQHFAYYYLIVQQILRYATDEQHRSMSKFVYFGIAIIAFFPWSAFIFQSIKKVSKSWKIRSKNTDDWFLLVWGISIVLFFAFSKSILVGYLLPIVVPFSILISLYLNDKNNFNIITMTDKIGIYIVSILFLVFSIASIVLLFVIHTKLSFDLFIIYASLISVISLATFVLCLIYLRKRNLKSIMVTFLCSMMLFANIGFCLGELLTQKSVKSFVPIMKHLIKKYPSAIIGGFDYYYDASFYFKRNIVIVGSGGELSHTSHYKNSGAKKGLISESNFWKNWQKKELVFALMDKNVYNRYFIVDHKKGTLLDHTQKNYLISNHKIYS